MDTEVAEEEASGVEEEELGKSEPTTFRARVPSEVERKEVSVSLGITWEYLFQ